MTKQKDDFAMSKSETDQLRLVYGVPEAGAMLGLSRNASYAAARSGAIPTIKIGKLLRVPIRALEQMLNATLRPDAA
jgi:hypothetical protein